MGIMDPEEARRLHNEQLIRDSIGRLESRDPFTPSDEAGIAMYEIFKGMVVGGFEEKQALFILGVMLASGTASTGSDETST